MKIIIIGLSALCLGDVCAATKQDVYWTKKDGVITVHHVSGKVDHAESLTNKKLSSDDVSSYKLSEKGKYFVVSQHNDVFVPEIKHDDSPSKKSDNSKDKLDKVTSELHDLKRQVSNLKEQLNTKVKPEIKKEPVASQSGNDETVAQDDSPRMSQ